MGLNHKYYFHEKTRKSPKYDFIISNPVEIDSFFKSMVLGQEEIFVYDNNIFEISAVDIRNKQELQSCVINLNYGIINVGGKNFKIDGSYIKYISKKFSMSYKLQKQSFKSYEDYQKQESVYIQDKRVFLISPPPKNRVIEGYFQVKFLLGKDVYSEREANDFLKKKMDAVSPESKFTLSNLVFPEKPIPKDVYIVDVACTKAAYDQLRLEKGKKLKWTPKEYEVSIYYKL
jgi:hypothetical protein